MKPNFIIYRGWCPWAGCHVNKKHAHIVCPRCGRLDYEGECPSCHRWKRWFGNAWLRRNNLLRPVLKLRGKK